MAQQCSNRQVDMFLPVVCIQLLTVQVEVQIDVLSVCAVEGKDCHRTHLACAGNRKIHIINELLLIVFAVVKQVSITLIATGFGSGIVEAALRPAARRQPQQQQQQQQQHSSPRQVPVERWGVSYTSL